MKATWGGDAKKKEEKKQEKPAAKKEEKKEEDDELDLFGDDNEDDAVNIFIYLIGCQRRIEEKEGRRQEGKETPNCQEFDCLGS